MSFEEKSGVVESPTEWGTWSQTLEEVTICVNVPEGTRTKELKIDINPSALSVKLKDQPIMDGLLFATIVEDNSCWTLEDRKLVRIYLSKSNKEAGATWHSLLKDKYFLHGSELDETQKKMTLERYQTENPGFDFSSAEITGNYQNGGPSFQ
eukprot:m.5586 g.5586  ORF g.5586 m.5586 type:complete len:152 (-) comp4413_c0_seq1:98-553(-)